MYGRVTVTVQNRFFSHNEHGVATATAVFIVCFCLFFFYVSESSVWSHLTSLSWGHALIPPPRGNAT